MGNASVYNIALKDISNYYSFDNSKPRQWQDEWDATIPYVFTKEAVRLNKELGLHIVNRHSGNMARKRKTNNK